MKEYTLGAKKKKAFLILLLPAAVNLSTSSTRSSRKLTTRNITIVILIFTAMKSIYISTQLKILWKGYITKLAGGLLVLC